MAEEKFTMEIGLNVLNHLGINLYSNIPAVISEVVANAWDADAQNVNITIGKDNIVIVDDGHGMSEADINNKYLYVGYERRKHSGEEITKLFRRPVMGRKGIGKLSLFSIADTIEIQTMKNGVKNGFTMSASKLKLLLEKKDNSSYHPEPLPADAIVIDKQGTRVTLTDLKKGTSTTENALRKRMARRFSIIGVEYNFNVLINGKPVLITDRDYFHKIQYLWHYGEEGDKCKGYCSKLEFEESRPNIIKIPGVGDVSLTGWIATVDKSGQLQDEEDNLNKIIILVRGKLAQEDILEDFPEGGLYSKYLIGEINADFLDKDDQEDSATTNRQEIKKGDPRYLALKAFIQGELKHIQNKWTELRNRHGKERALVVPVIKEWFSSLSADQKPHAESLFGKINQLHIEDEEERKQLFKYGVLAFESFRYKENLDALDKITVEDMKALSKIFADHDDIEATLYHQITKGRLKVIEVLQKHVDDAALEKVLQEHLYGHLWLLDPAWDRATETPYMEQQVKKAFDGIDAGLTSEEAAARFDIKYKMTSGKHIIIELKKADRLLSFTEIMQQMNKYINALAKLLKAAGKETEPIEAICLVGKPLKEWTNAKDTEQTKRAMAEMQMRVVMYQQLIEDAYRTYQAYAERKEAANRVYKLIEGIEDYKS